MRGSGKFGRRWRGQRRLLGATTVLVAVVVFGVVFVASSGANLLNSTFEGSDGNMVVNGAGHTDWASLAGNAGLQTLVDLPSGSNDNAFGQGTKENDLTPTVVTGSIPPNKNDLTRSYLYNEQVGANSFLYLAWERTSNIGDAHVDFELDQKATPGFSGSTTGTVTLNRTPGDLLVSYDFGGSGTPVISLSSWSGSAWGTAKNLSALGFAEAAVNTAAIPDALNNNANIGIGDFGEASVNLSDALVSAGFSPDTCESYGSVFVKSRSSGASDSAELKDFIAPVPIHASNCATPTIVTHESDSGLMVGQAGTVGDSATLTGGNNPTGSVSFTLYSDAQCTTSTGVTGSGTVSGGAASVSNLAFTPSAAGTYYWGVSYAGDNHNNAASACGGANESVTVSPASPTISTQESDSGLIVGQAGTVGDTATFHGAYNASGSVDFTLYKDASCTQATSISDSGSISAGTASVSDPWTPAAAGTYYWGVNYAGDANNNSYSACAGANESVTVSPASPAVSTVADPASALLGAASLQNASDTATFTDGYQLSGQSVDFTLYSDSNCQTSTGISGSELIGQDGKATFTGDASALPAGMYYWGVGYAGDANNNGVAECGGDQGVQNETLSIGLALPSIVTTQNPASAIVGSTVNDSAQLSDGVNVPQGTITFDLYSSANCARGTIVDTETVSVDGNGAYATPAGYVTTSAGTYEWIASYSGDASNASASTQCGDEPVEIGPASPAVSTVADPAAGIAGSTALTTASDTATFTDGYQLSGQSVSFTLYSDSSCDPADATSVSGTAQIGQDGKATFIGDASGLPVGTYYWGVGYAGDTNNNGIAECGGDEGVQNETLAIAPASPTIATALSSSSVSVGATVHDSATLGGATADAGGNVTYAVYSDSACTSKVADGGTVAISNGAVPNSNGVQFNTAGTYYWQASYSGDAKNNPAKSACTDEKLVVAPLIDLSVTKVGTPNPDGPPIGNITWTMVVTNNGPSTATGVQAADAIPAGNTFISASTSQGSCTGGAVVSCSIGTMASGASVTITIVTTPTAEGMVTNTITVVGNEQETNTANNTASASVLVVAAHTPPAYCTALIVRPKQLYVGRKTNLHIKVTQHGKAIAGVRVRIKGAHINAVTKASNHKGMILRTLKPKRAGIIIFKPIATKSCASPKVGITGVFTPPVTG